MDHNLREIGLSDVGVPRKMRKFGEAFYGRAKVYDQALDAHDAAALADALGRNIFRRPDGASDGAARCLAAYVEASDATLAGQEPATIAGGTIRFPEFCVAQVAR